MKVFVVILALAGAGYAAYIMKKSPDNKKSMIVFMALGLAIAWLTTAAEIRRSEMEKIVITPNSTARVEEQNLDKAVEEAKKRAEERAELKEKQAQMKLYVVGIAQQEPTREGFKEKSSVAKKLEDGRYGAEFKFKPDAKKRWTTLDLLCVTGNDTTIVDAELTIEPQPDLRFLEQHLYDKSSSNTDIPKQINWTAEYSKNGPSKINVLVITKDDPGTVKCNYKETGFDV